MRRKLPPFNALKAFEASARTGGFLSAADELGVSAAAVSQQIKNLERFFGRDLFTRHNNRVALTEAGQAIFNESAGPIEQLADMTRHALGGEVRPRLVISVVGSVAVRWLNRRIPAFLAEHPGLRCELRVEEDPVDFARHGIDVRICYGDHLYPGLVTSTLVRDQVLPLCTPAFQTARQIRDDRPESLRDEDLIHTNWGPAFVPYPTWDDWLARAGAKRTVAEEHGHGVDMASLAVDLARAGTGVALGQRLLAHDELSDGRLRAPFRASVPLAHPYCAVHSQSRTHKAGVRAFIAWATNVARASVDSA